MDFDMVMEDVAESPTRTEAATDDQMIAPAWDTAHDEPFADSESTAIVPNKVYIRGLDTLSTEDVKTFVEDHFGRVNKIEWINDESANLVFQSEDAARDALRALSAQPEAAAQTSAGETVPAKDIPSKPEVNLQIRIALQSDKKAPGAATRSRYYLFHPDQDPEERRRREGRRRYRERENNGYRGRDSYARDRRGSDEIEVFDASLYDDDEATLASRAAKSRTQQRRSRSRGSASGLGGSRRTNAEKELFPNRSSLGNKGSTRNRSASPLRDLLDSRPVVLQDVDSDWFRPRQPSSAHEPSLNNTYTTDNSNLKEGQASYKGHLPPAPAALEEIVDDRAHAWHHPTLDQTVDILYTLMMTKSVSTPLPVEFDPHIRHLLEGFSGLQTSLHETQQLLAEETETKRRSLDEFTTMSIDWGKKESDYKAEIRRLELLLARAAPEGVAAVVLARSGSVVDRSLAESRRFKARIRDLTDGAGVDPILSQHAQAGADVELGDVCCPTETRFRKPQRFASHRSLLTMRQDLAPDADVISSERLRRHSLRRRPGQRRRAATSVVNAGSSSQEPGVHQGCRPANLEHPKPGLYLGPGTGRLDNFLRSRLTDHLTAGSGAPNSSSTDQFDDLDRSEDEGVTETHHRRIFSFQAGDDRLPMVSHHCTSPSKQCCENSVIDRHKASTTSLTMSPAKRSQGEEVGEAAESTGYSSNEMVSEENAVSSSYKRTLTSGGNDVHEVTPTEKVSCQGLVMAPYEDFRSPQCRNRSASLPEDRCETTESGSRSGRKITTRTISDACQRLTLVDFGRQPGERPSMSRSSASYT
ncbi:conserved hypothetical protein [Verticillium alfalfae VaMs.102]|uniref:RRM domain-containing protein n=1 Tax=Verticillium alfalfae (strain VaMs.102 / ATCC MYA-4576 / FGSC 10136) TaxID=526221 RepID=C9SX27_VERA1|nr:conserved hypothetical protein [Verticillium alfalfae VaMs.102]EEY23217.1 conserved hypothetical protein [Verticillium alfalfae VaMs.102]